MDINQDKGLTVNESQESFNNEKLSDGGPKGGGLGISPTNSGIFPGSNTKTGFKFPGTEGLASSSFLSKQYPSSFNNNNQNVAKNTNDSLYQNNSNILNKSLNNTNNMYPILGSVNLI